MKKSFTLIEVIISIIIFSIIMIFMSNVIDSLNSSVKTLNHNYNKNRFNSYTIKTLYTDILNSDYITLKNKNKNYSILYLKTSNSLYNIAMPYVIWYVSKKDNTLMRLESSKKINLPIKEDKNILLDRFLNNIKIFKIYKNKNKYFIFIKGNQTLYFEI